MLPACRTEGESFSLPTLDLVPSDVEGCMEALWEFQSLLHDCFARSEPDTHFFDYIARCNHVAAKPVALSRPVRVADGDHTCNRASVKCATEPTARH